MEGEFKNNYSNQCNSQCDHSTEDMKRVAEPEEAYQSVLAARYCRNSPLLALLSENHRLWIWLAEGEMALGLKNVSAEAVQQMVERKENIDWTRLRSTEKRLKHDIMAHIEVYGKACPRARGVIHLGATSCYVQDNADLLVQHEALTHIILRLAVCLKRLGEFAQRHADWVTPGRTHYQEASMTTVGKRACIWAQELLMVLNSLSAFKEGMRFRGIKGATGTQDSFLTLFNGDEEAVERLDAYVTEKAGFGPRRFRITGQTYSRQQDADLLYPLSKLGAVAKKICSDIRILQALNELMEPFEAEQVGSSAMPYKRNPMRSERVCGLARHLMQAVNEALNTLADQGLERTLDDSSNRRVVISEAFLTAEAILTTLQNIFEGMSVPGGCARLKSLPFLALEKALMILSSGGVGREEGHAKIRTTALAAIERMEHGQQVEVSELLADPFFDACREEVIALCSNPLNFTGRCVSQVGRFLGEELMPAIEPLLGGGNGETGHETKIELDV